MDLRKIASAYINKGLSVIPINEHKQPTYEWYSFQNKMMTQPEIEEHFKNAAGLGIVCGDISGLVEGQYLTVIDIDTKNFDSEITYEQIYDSIPKEIMDKLLVSTTRSGGYHWYFRSPLGGGNKKLAMRPTTAEERTLNPKQKVTVCIETRAIGGFVCAAPTPGYEVISEARKIPELSLDDALVIVDACCSFNRVIDEASLYEQFAMEKKNKFLQSPFDSANERMDVLGLLTSNGYTIVGSAVDNKVKLRRPGRVSSSHSGYYDAEHNKYINFSTSSEFECGKSYNASALFTILECRGDWADSYKKLLDKGFGIPVDYTKKINKFITNFNNKNLKALLELAFDATPAKDGVMIEGKFYPCK